MKRINQVLIALVVISATVVWAITPSYAQSRPRIVSKAKTDPPRIVTIEIRPRRVFPPNTKQPQIPRFEQFVDRIYRLIDEYSRPANR